MHRKQILKIAWLLVGAALLHFLFADQLLSAEGAWWVQAIVLLAIFTVGIGYVFRGAADIIEETTDVLKDRTGLAGGLLQAFGTAFPDMIIGIVAAVLSLQVRGLDSGRAIDLAILAASATFGSNIYNIVHAAWCVYRQNRANALRSDVLMLPPFKAFGSLQPIERHATKPQPQEMDGAIRILTALTMLTALTAISMVLFGKVPSGRPGVTGDLYQLVLPVGIALFFACSGVLYFFRKSHRAERGRPEIAELERYYDTQKTPRIWLDLILSGVAILLVAESMVRGMEVFSHLAHVPFVITGILAGIIGCFGEMIIVHNFSVHPHGRIGDAIVGVAMDNIVTTLGASLVAIIGGIFLGGDSLILIFIIILAANTLLIEQIARFKNSLAPTVNY
jgi:MFS family permease